MGLLSRLRAWFADRFGGADADEAPADDGEPDAADDDGDEEGKETEETTLDPAAATETRTAATDDAVNALRDVQKSRETIEAADDGAGVDDGVGVDDNAGSDHTTEADDDRGSGPDAEPDASTDRERS